MIEAVFRDFKFAIRSFARRPLFTGVILLTLALGIGSNVAIFSVANAVLFQALPFDAPDELAFVWTRLPATNVERSLVSGPDFKDYQTGTTLFEGFAGAVAVPGTLTGDGPAEQIMNAYTTWNLFKLLGVRPMLGRNFVADDAFAIDPKAFGQPNPNLPPGKVMLTYGLWQRRFGGDRNVIGRTIQMDGWGSIIVGVLPPDFRIYLPADAAMPTNIDAWGVLPSNIGDFERDAPWLTVVTRLRDGVSLDQGQQQMNALAARLREVHQFHKTQNLQIVLNGMHRDVVNHARPALLALLGAVGFVLLIACANIANLLLVRASERGREIAVRAAIGSGRGRIVVQMLIESVVLAVGGALLGVLLAWQGIGVIKALSPSNLPRLESVAIDGRALAFAAGATLLAAVAFGLAPALRAVAGNLVDKLRDRGSDSGGVRGNKLRTTLAVIEVTLSLVLLIGAGLMVRSFREIQNVDPGFDAENVVTFNAPLQFLKYLTTESRGNFHNQLGARLAQIPGVESVGAVAPLPLAGGEQYSVGSYGRPGGPDDVYRAQKADFKSVLPGYFETMKIELVSGRTFVPSDNEVKALDVAIIDQKLANRIFRGEEPLGKQLIVDHFNEQTFSLERLPVQIVGVVSNVRSASLASEGRESIYVPYVFQSFLPLTYVVRTKVDAATLVPQIRSVVSAMDRDVPVAGTTTLDSYVTNAMSQTRFLLALISTFAVLAVILASLGLYGVISYSARQRTREIGVRVALGASSQDVVRLILKQGMAVAGIGILLGLGGAMAATRVVKSYLVGVSAVDPVTFAGVPVILLVVTAVASFLPARRASGIDPMTALREE
ncbi:MAG TPA: ABC transporter permease [Gemmatimonadaceae bacterium]|jgi:putative ABC transport system permease protein|nr:ABC transporter permease [Gemmatimonadaceae bacterium]